MSLRILPHLLVTSIILPFFLLDFLDQFKQRYSYETSFALYSILFMKRSKKNTRKKMPRFDNILAGEHICAGCVCPKLS